ncbi:MAG: hypothetical protein QM765_26285 [Myxococcales bacterium]
MLRCDRCSHDLVVVEELGSSAKVLGRALRSKTRGRVFLCRDCYEALGRSDLRAREFAEGLRPLALAG